MKVLLYFYIVIKMTFKNNITMTKSIDEYLEIIDSNIIKTKILEIILTYMVDANDRLWSARNKYSSDNNFSDFEYNSHDCIIKEMAVQRWILRYENELKK